MAAGAEGRAPYVSPHFSNCPVFQASPDPSSTNTFPNALGTHLPRDLPTATLTKAK